MRHKVLFLALAATALGTGTEHVYAGKSGHQFGGNIQTQYRNNTNVSVSTASNGGFNFADPDDFEDDDEDFDDEGDDDDEDDDDFDDAEFDDLFDDADDAEFDEDELEEDDAIDEDGDGIDDLIDPNADIRVDREDRFTLKLGLNHKYSFENPAWAWSNGVRFTSDTHQQRDDLDKFNYAFTTGFAYAPKDSAHKLRSSLSYVVLDKDNKKFVSTFIVSTGYSYAVSKRLTLGATYNYQDKDITNPDAPDATVDTLALTADFKASKNDIFKLRWAPKVEDSTKVTRNTDAYGYEITYTRKLPWDMTAGIGYRFDNIDYKNIDPRREDDNETWGLEVTKAFNKQWSMDAGYEARDRRSNIEGKDAENETIYVSLEYKF